MTPADSSEHVADLLPEYGGGRLSAPLAARVHDHLATCDACAAELQAWRRIAEAESQVAVLAPAPSASVLTGALARIDAETPVVAAPPAISVARQTVFAASVA